MKGLESLERLTRAVEAARVDIAPTYKEYLALALAIATDCGEAGRSHFHRICVYHSDYCYETADKFFTNLLKSNKGEVTLGSVFHLASQAGIQVKTENTDENIPADSADHSATGSHIGRNNHAKKVYNMVESPEASANALMRNAAASHTRTRGILTNVEPLIPLPCFAEYDWPEPLRTVLSYASTPHQRDVMLLGALTVLGASLEKHVRCSYAGKWQYPCMQTFIVAPPASGKGVLSLLRLLVVPIHNELRKAFQENMKKYLTDKAAYDSLGKERAGKEVPEKPVNKMFLISGNNSGTGILQNIMDANGVGLIFETEADTISTAIGSDYGHWSDTLRKTFDHDMLAYNRRMDQEYREVTKSYLSVLLSGTPAQVKPLIPSAENGLFSRQIFYYMPGIHQWQNQFDTADTDLEAVFTQLGEQWKIRLHELHTNGNYNLCLTNGQKQMFNDTFAALFLRAGLANDNEMNSSVARMAINICRILSIVALLRGDGIRPAAHLKPENVKAGKVGCWDVTVNESDFRAVMGMVKVLYSHATHILSLLPATEVTRRDNSDYDAFFAALPEIFTREEFNRQIADWNINKHTAESWLMRSKKKGFILSPEKDGKYMKTIHFKTSAEKRGNG